MNETSIMKNSFPQKVALVTGGSRGIGAATCLQLAKAGYAVVVNYAASQAITDKLCESIIAAGGTALGLQADVADEAQVLAMFAAIDTKFGRLDALVNNAGVVDITARLDEMSVARWTRMFDINVIGSLICTRGREAHEHAAWAKIRGKRRRDCELIERSGKNWLAWAIP